MKAFLKKKLQDIGIFFVIVLSVAIVMFAMAEGDLDTLTYYFGYAFVSISIGVVFGFRAFRTLGAKNIGRDAQVTCALLVSVVVIPIMAVTLSSIGAWSQRGLVVRNLCNDG